MKSRTLKKDTLVTRANGDYWTGEKWTPFQSQGRLYTSQGAGNTLRFLVESEPTAILVEMVQR